MVKTSNADNKFGLTSFVVGTSLGDGCNYSVIQQAIDDCFAAGGGVVGIRAGTYTENLTFRNKVNISAFDVDGRPPIPIPNVTIQGHHTFAPSTGTFATVVIENIGFNDPAFGNLLTISPTAGTFCIFALKYCGLTSDDGVNAGVCLVLNSDVTSLALCVYERCMSQSGSHNVNMIGAGSNQLQCNFHSGTARSGDFIRMATGSCGTQIQSSSLNAQNGVFSVVEDLTGTGQITASYTEFDANGSSIAFTTPGGTMTSYHCTYVANGANYISGTGTFNHFDSGVSGGAHTLAGTVTEAKLDWQPYASAGASASPVGVAPRGTASFDSSQFTVTNGWVHLSVTPGAFLWVNQPGSVVVPSNQGNFATGAVTLTLPPAPVQGDVCKFKVVQPGGPLVIAANAGQTLQVANQTGTTATSTQFGDAMELTYYAAGTTWCADSIIGNWNTV